MKVWNLYNGVRKMVRVSHVMTIIAKHAIKELIDRTMLRRRSRRNAYSRRAGNVERNNKGMPRHKVYTTAERIRQTIEELGPTFVKFGQILADRPDMVSESLRRELKKLQSRVRPFDNDLAIALIEKNMGDSIDNIFMRFDNSPLAAASIGQVYRGRLFSGDEVVIKIQRPGVLRKIKLDISLMKVLARRLAKSYPEFAAINIVALVDEFSDQMLREVDYTIESTNIKIFERMFATNLNIKIPRVFDQYTTHNLIVTEYIVGVTPDNRSVLERSGLDPDEVVRRGADALFTMILHYGVFHADPHPGNIFVMRGNRVAFIDFGMIGMLRPKDINFLADFTVGFARKDSEMITRSLITLCGRRFFEHEDALSFDIHRMLVQNIASKVVDMRNFSKVMQSSIDILTKYSLQIPEGIFMLIKTIATLEKFAASIAPNLDLAPIVLPYAKAIISERHSARRVARQIFDTAVNYMNLVNDLPRDIGEILFKLKEGKIKHDIKLNDEQLFTRTLKEVSLRLAYAIVLIGLFIGSAVLLSLDHSSRFAPFVMTVTTGLILLLLIKWATFKK